MPVTQIELAEATGLTSVHVNRTLQEMRGTGLIRLKGRTLDIPDLLALDCTMLFSPGYLHLERLAPYRETDRVAQPLGELV